MRMESNRSLPPSRNGRPRTAWLKSDEVMRLTDNPELVNSDPYGEGWLIKVQLQGGLPPDLLDEAAYRKVTEKS